MAKSKSHERTPKAKNKHLNHAHQRKEAESSRMNLMNTLLTLTCMAVAAWFGYKGYLETRVNTPFDTEKLVSLNGLDTADRYWGTYRSNLYFGMKTRDPQSLASGLMWYRPNDLRQGSESFRHWCEQSDKLEKYGWLEHDGKTFGIQEIVDGDLIIKTSYVKKPGGRHGGDWTARIGVTFKEDVIQSDKSEEISFIFYSALEDKSTGNIKASLGADNRLSGMEGYTDGLGAYRFSMNPTKGTVEEHSFLIAVMPGLDLVRETVLQNLRLASQKGSNLKRIVLGGDQLPLDSEGKKTDPNFCATQVTAKVPFEFEVLFESGSVPLRKEKLTGKNFDAALGDQRKRFHEKFEKTFKLEEKGFKEDAIEFAKLAFSNLIGSIGYFYGTAQVQSVYTKSPVPYWKAPLYTAVPSRSFFPRGFLWDEGFHGLLISTWDLDIELDIMSHWFDLMNSEGWIPREMILGSEALKKVPEEFVTQISTNANPPTFFLTLEYILNTREVELLDRHYKLLGKIYPRLQVWFEWFNTTQVGDLPGTYRWRGRDSLTNRELNPKTLTSGLDDYPRASHPNVDERHVDLRCWIAFASGVMARLASLLEQPSQRYNETHQFLTDNQLLNHLHWSGATQAYADYGLHTDKVELRRPSAPPRSPASPDLIRVVLEDPTLRFVDSAFGYVSLFPFILGIVESNSPNLDKILNDITKPELLWTKYGLRSLAKSSPHYMKYNTEHDPPYWRGAIWMNLNYLTLRALNHYSEVQGPYQAKAGRIYKELRENVIKNMMAQYKRTGFLWENYGDSYGEGKGSHPFNGWSSLVVMIMAEIY
uniref:Mannosyl-oligosaccharide glucosidase n=1 Tax=Fopius arisanus TaxID=64838 RepID=A0A0C9R244_9HYME